MKKQAFRLGFLALVPLVLTGCLVFSLNPWIEADDRVYDERFIGRWTSGGVGIDDEVWEFNVGWGRDKCYLVKWFVRTDERTTRHKITACLARIDDEYYVDYTGIGWNEDDDDKPTHDLTSHLHQVARIRFDEGRLIIHTLGGNDGQIDTGLLGGLDARPYSDSQEFETDALLLESTGDLREYLERYGSEEATWDVDPIVILTRKP